MTKSNTFTFAVTLNSTSASNVRAVLSNEDQKVLKDNGCYIPNEYFTFYANDYQKLTYLMADPKTDEVETIDGTTIMPNTKAIIQVDLTKRSKNGKPNPMIDSLTGEVISTHYPSGYSVTVAKGFKSKMSATEKLNSAASSALNMLKATG